MTQLSLAGGTGGTVHIGQSLSVARRRLPRWLVVLGACGIQITFALVLREARALAVLHVAAVAVVGLYAVMTRRVVLMVLVLAHLTGAEVLWRQSRAPVFFMVAPYLTMALCGLAIIVIFRGINRTGRVAALFGLLLLPSSMITITLTSGGARQLLAFALAGPLALAAAVMALSQVRMNLDTYRRILWTVVISAFGPWAFAVGEIRSYQATAGAIDFRTESNFVTAGGFGPVHVSAILSAGTVAALLLTVIERRLTMRVLAGLMGATLIVQSLLTFSRGGIYSAAIATSAFVLASATNRRALNRMLLMVGLALVVGYVLVLPRIESFTQGAFSERFTSTETSRSTLAAGDVQTFLEHPAFGVGPGMGKYQRIPYDLCQMRTDRCNNEVSSHTEFTRMLSEHGLPGLLALLALVILATRALGPAARSQRFLAAPWVAWVMAQMAYANLRIVAVPILFGFAFMAVVKDPERGDPQPAASPNERASVR